MRKKSYKVNFLFSLTRVWQDGDSLNQKQWRFARRYEQHGIRDRDSSSDKVSRPNCYGGRRLAVISGEPSLLISGSRRARDCLLNPLASSSYSLHDKQANLLIDRAQLTDCLLASC